MSHSPRALVKSPMKNFRHTYDLLTGSALISYRLSQSEHPWLAHHKVFDRVTLVETGLLELALAAGLAVGSPRVVELTLAAPLTISAAGGSQVQVQVQAADAQGRRAFSLHSQDEASFAESGGWILHAMGVLAGAEATAEAGRCAASRGVATGGEHATGHVESLRSIARAGTGLRAGIAGTDRYLAPRRDDLLEVALPAGHHIRRREVRHSPRAF